MLKPKVFKDSRNAREVDNLVWSMERYFKAAGVRDDAPMLLVVSMFMPCCGGNDEVMMVDREAILS